MLILWKVSVAALLLAGACLSLAGCGQVQNEKVAQGTPGIMPAAEKTRQLPGPMPSQVVMPPNPVETAYAVATDKALAPTVLAAQSATAKAFHDLLATPVLAKDYGSWSFTASRNRIYDPGPKWQVLVNINRDTSSVRGLQSYAISNSQLAYQVAKQHEGHQLQVQITLRNYMSVEQFNKWVSATGIQPKYEELRVIYDRDPLYTPIPRRSKDAEFVPDDVLRVDSEFGDAEPLPRSRVDQALNTQKETARTYGYVLRELKGVYFTVAMVEAKRLPRIAEDPSVFLADISYYWVLYELKASGAVDMDTIRITNSSPMPESVFRYMEQFGLDKFAK